MKHIFIKAITISCFLAGIASTALAQQNQKNSPIKVTTGKLDNGMKVVLVEEHSSPMIYGVVDVHVGSKNDPLDATGMAHYFEHIMFKGTDSIGTTNWAKEKPILDSIEMLYDQLHATTDPAQRKALQSHINDLSIASTQYAIPNEVSTIAATMGGTGLNAGTSYDQTMYLNTFPANQLEKWMQFYTERFRNPVFRLFQSELEAVYEEKNMYADGPMQGFLEMVLKEAFGEHPYGRPIIGYTEHLKNPQPSKMHDFYKQYYVPNNMTLILVGDLNPDEAMAMAHRTFGRLQHGNIPAAKTYTFPTFKNGDIKEVKLTPIKMGVVMWRGISVCHEDAIKLDVLNAILSNGASGLLDRLALDNQLLGASPLALSLEDGGVNGFLYIPKLLGQSHAEAEALIMACIDSLKQGRFDEDLLAIAKMDYVVAQQRMFEDIYNISNIFTQLDINGKTYDQFLAELESVKHLTKADIVALANKYYDDQYLTIRSGMGFPQKDKVEKPQWKHLESHNSNASSQFAQRIAAIPGQETVPQVIEFAKDITTTKVNDAFRLYSVTNPVNDIFELTITYSQGTNHDADLERAIGYWELNGTTTKDMATFSKELQKIGASMSLTAHANSTDLTITGFDPSLPQVLTLVAQKVKSPGNDEKQISTLIDGFMTERQSFKTDASAWADAVIQYACYGSQSPLLRRTPLKEWKQRSGEELLAEVNRLFNYDGHITYTGNCDPVQVAQLLAVSGLVKDNAYHGVEIFNRKNNMSKPQVFVADNKKFNQSNIYFMVPGEVPTQHDRAISSVFNKYFGHDMYSIVFQEIREFRSLGYTAYSTFSYDPLRRDRGFLLGYLGTQSDKTLDGIEAMHNLMTDMPMLADKFHTAQNSLVLSRQCDHIHFRSLPSQIIEWQRMGYTSDPRPDQVETIKNANMNDLQHFFDTYIKGRPISIMMSGNTKRFNIKDLSKYGNVVSLKESDIITW